VVLRTVLAGLAGVTDVLSAEPAPSDPPPVAPELGA